MKQTTTKENEMETRTITEKQESYIEALIEKELEQAGNHQIAFTTGDRAVSYALALNMEVPEDKAEASEMIDALKNGGAKEYARRHPRLAQRVLGILDERFGGSWKAINEAASERVSALEIQDKKRVQESSKAFRQIVLDPLLSV